MGTVSKLNCVNNYLCISAKFLMRSTHLCVIMINDKQLKYLHEVANWGEKRNNVNTAYSALYISASELCEQSQY